MRDTEKKRLDKQFSEILAHTQGDKIEIAARVYKFIQQEENSSSALQYFLENIDDMDNFENEEISEDKELERIFHEESIEKLTKECSQLVGGVLDKIIGQNLEPEDFYQELWEKGIEENVLLSKEKEKIYALYRIWTDGRIPYFKLDEGVYMDSDRFSAILKEKRKDVKKMIFIFNSVFSQRTERSSQFVKILDACKTDEEKAVIMTQILSLTEEFGRFQERLKAAKMTDK